jgi:hypothetical protein
MVTVRQNKTEFSDEVLISVTDSLMDPSSKTGKTNKGALSMPADRKPASSVIFAASFAKNSFVTILHGVKKTNTRTSR